MVARYGSRAQYVVEDLGNSPLADRFGVDKYPALFVDDALVARPEDFYGWGSEAQGKYMPWTDLEKRRQYQSDVARMIDIRLAGGNVPSLKVTAAKNTDRRLPESPLVDLEGRTFSFAAMRGKPVVVEFWATWCPFCHTTLDWLKDLDPELANVVVLVVDSEPKDVEKLAAKIVPRPRMAVATPEHRAAFDGPPAIPLVLVADAEGRIVKTYFGAPGDLRESVMRDLAAMGK